MLKLFFNREETNEAEIEASIKRSNLILRGRVERLLELDAQRKTRFAAILCDKSTERRQSYYN